MSVVSKKDLKDGLLRDGFGEIVQLPGGAPFVNERGNIEVKKALDKSRIHERNAGCWSCLHFDTGELYETVKLAAHRRDVAVLSQTMPAGAAHRKADKNKKWLEKHKGFMGVCRADKSESEFVSYQYLCGNWSGKTGASLARAPGEPLSPLADELKDKAGD